MSASDSARSEVRIRAAEPADLSALYALLRGKADFDGALDALTASETELGRALFSEAPGCEVAVAARGERLVGFVAWYPIFSTFRARPGLWMEDLFVAADERGHGIGRALLVHLARIATERGCCKLEWSLQTVNTRGIAFYEREGAKVREGNRFAKLDEAGLATLLAQAESPGA